MKHTYLEVTIFLFSLTFFLHVNNAISQNQRREIKAIRVSEPPVIDGQLDEAAWEKAHIATDFFQYEPHNDRPATQKTKVKVLYDDYAIYIGAVLYDANPDSILTELGLRNSGGNLNADRFWVDLNPFNDGINGFRFQVSASGIQTDINMSGSTSNGGDRNWDAVWKSEVSITDTGWIVEIKIPYSALRFPKQNIHKWGVNFWREVRRTREVSNWNFVDRRIGNAIGSLGELNGIEGITPPLRLAIYPYLSNYLENQGNDAGWNNAFNGGLDLKLGISESFTMDMTLIPDFGQVQSDPEILNLTPFEVRYDENRQFFTEGTELFGKAGLFYSRRIGATPKSYYKPYKELDDNEYILENPSEARLINATKVSGRTTSGLGMGLFNAMTAPSHAVIVDSITDSRREITTQGFTNYNLVVLDQSLKNNSYISFINTNVAGAIDGYTANVSGTDFRFLDKSNMYRFSGYGSVSQKYFNDQDDIFGHKYYLNAGKVGGTWQYNIARSVASNLYDHNDMGFIRHNNYIGNWVNISHNIFEPFSRFWTLSNTLSFNLSHRYEPYTFSYMYLGYQLRMLFDTRFFIMFNANYSPVAQKDFFEPRVHGRFYEIDEMLNLYMYYSSDYRRRVYVDGSFAYRKVFSEYGQENFTIDIKPTFRASDKLNLSYRVNYFERNNNIGYVKHLNADTIYFGKRYSPTLTNAIITNYIYSKDFSLSFNLRHYWSQVDYLDEYYFLNNDGSLSFINENLNISNINYNAFTIDMILIWHFAPGSQLSFMWKNSIFSNTRDLPESYLENLSIMLQEPQINSFSIKMLYYLDYQQLKHFNPRNRS